MDTNSNLLIGRLKIYRKKKCILILVNIFTNFLNNIVMKRFLLMLVMVLGFTVADAQVQYYRTTGFAYKQMNYGRWSNWSDWEDSDMLITINLSNDVVKIYSPTTQTYRILSHTRNFTDTSGGQQMEFKFIDQDGDRGTMRLRIERNGNSQLYIQFSNIIWVYNVVRTS